MKGGQIDSKKGLYLLWNIEIDRVYREKKIKMVVVNLSGCAMKMVGISAMFYSLV